MTCQEWQEQLDQANADLTVKQALLVVQQAAAVVADAQALAAHEAIATTDLEIVDLQTTISGIQYEMEQQDC